jgi:hypothetical protein
MAWEFEVVDVWVGHFPDEATFDSYVEELPRVSDDDPLSEFVSDMGQRWYDHDFLGTCYHGGPSEDIAALLGKGHAFAASYADAAAEAHRRLGLGPANVTITMWGEEIRNPRSVRRPSYRLDYLGRFACDPDADESHRN